MTGQDGMVSVILPVRNGDLSLLRAALDSVRRQTVQNYEILLTDDGSGESFARELDRLAAEDGRIRLFHLEPCGVAAARNHAIDRAEGAYITFLDADDELSPVFFEEALTLMRDPSIDVLWGGTRYFNDEQRAQLPDPGSVRALSPQALAERSVRLSPARIHQSRAEVVGEPLRFEDAYINRGIAARFLRSGLFTGGKHRFPPGFRLYEDTIWDLGLLEETQVVLVKSLWYYYYENMASASNRFQPALQAEMETALARIRQILDLKDPTEYTAYTRFLMDSLRYVYRCCVGHPDRNPSDRQSREARQSLYREEPWREIGTEKYLRFSSPRDRQKAYLYRMHLLFLWWRITR